MGGLVQRIFGEASPAGSRPQPTTTAATLRQKHSAIYGAAGFAGGWIGYAFGLVTTAPSIQIGNNAIEFINNPLVKADYAFTLGNAINFGTNSEPWKNGAYGDPDVNIGMHEQAHTYQGQVLGIFFGPAYLLTGRYADPLSNPFERVQAKPMGLGAEVGGHGSHKSRWRVVSLMFGCLMLRQLLWTAADKRFWIRR